MNIPCPQCGKAATAGSSSHYSKQLHQIPFQCSNPACRCSFSGTLQLSQTPAPASNRFNNQNTPEFLTDC